MADTSIPLDPNDLISMARTLMGWFEELPLL
jgi:hypothetical protein